MDCYFLPGVPDHEKFYSRELTVNLFFTFPHTNTVLSSHIPLRKRAMDQELFDFLISESSLSQPTSFGADFGAQLLSVALRNRYDLGPNFSMLPREPEPFEDALEETARQYHPSHHGKSIGDIFLSYLSDEKL